MIYTESMRQERLIQHLKEEKEIEEERLKELDRIRGMTEIVTLRNMKVMHIAEIEQMIRKAKERLETAWIREAARQKTAILRGGTAE